MQQVMVPLRLSVQTKTNKADNFFKKEAHIREDPRSQVSILTKKEAMSMEKKKVALKTIVMRSAAFIFNTDIEESLDPSLEHKNNKN